MTISPIPLVSIGLPVYNGGEYLKATIESLLGQTYSDFELIISDNGSSDRTPLICEEYAARDARIRYHRFEQNVGAARNYNYVFESSRGQFFKWAAHDDLCAPEFIFRCVEALESDATAVLAYPKVVIIDPDGHPIQEYDEGKNLDSGDPTKRFESLMAAPKECNAIFGLIRSTVLATTPLIGVYNASDLNLLAELALHGRFREVPEPLFFRREHPKRPLYMAKTDADKVAWYDPVMETRIVLPNWRQIFEHGRAVARVRMTLSSKLRCYFFVARLASWRRGALIKDLGTVFENGARRMSGSSQARRSERPRADRSQ